MGAASSSPSSIVLEKGGTHAFLVSGMPVIEDKAKNVFYVDTAFNDTMDATQSSRLGALCGAQTREHISLLGTRWAQRDVGAIHFNFPGDRLTVAPAPSSFSPAHTFPLTPMPPYGPILIARVLVNGKPYRALVDTGSRWTYAYRRLSQIIEKCPDAHTHVNTHVSCGVTSPDSIKVRVQNQAIDLHRVAARVVLGTSTGGPAVLTSIFASCVGDNEIMADQADLTLGLDFLSSMQLFVDFAASQFHLS